MQDCCQNSCNDGCCGCLCEIDAARAWSYYYFENILMLIVILWLIKWLFAC